MGLQSRSAAEYGCYTHITRFHGHDDSSHGPKDRGDGAGDMAKQPWTLEFYTDQRGKSPIQEFIDNLPLKERNAVRRYLDRLENWGTALGMPHARRLRGPI